MFHNASTGGKPGDNGENGYLNLGADLCPSRGGSLFLAPCSGLPPLYFHQVLCQPFPHSSPDLPNFSPPQLDAPLQSSHPPLFQLLLSEYFPTSSPLRVLDCLLEKTNTNTKSLACLPLGKIQWERMAQRSTQASLLLGAVTSLGPTR